MFTMRAWELAMRFATILSAVILTGLFVGSADAQVSGRRHRLYPPTYNGYGVTPGLSVYENGFYSLDTFGGHSYRHFGYTPPRSGRYGNPAVRYNGLYGAPNNWMYYPGMELSPYNVNSPIWSYGSGW